MNSSGGRLSGPVPETTHELVAEIMRVERSLRELDGGAGGRDARADLHLRRRQLIVTLETVVRRKLRDDGAEPPHRGHWTRGWDLRAGEAVWSVAREGVTGTVFDQSGVDRVVRWVDDVLESIENDDVYERVVPDDLRRDVPDAICRQFADSYRHWAIELPAELPLRLPVSVRNDRGWWLRVRFDEIDGMPALEVYASHRMTNDSHYVVHADGSVRSLDALLEMWTYPAGASDAEIAVAREANLSSYRRLSRRLERDGML